MMFINGRCLVLVGALVIQGMITCVCLAEDASALPAPVQSKDISLPAPHSDGAVKVVALKHADAHVLAKAIRELDLPVWTAAINSNTLVLNGAAESVKMVVENFIPSVDAPSVAGDSSGQPEFFPVRYYPMDEIEPMVRSVAPHASLGIDRIRQVLVIQGTESEERAVRELLQQIDKPARAARIQMFFLGASLSGDKSGRDAAPLPAELSAIAKTLSQNGFERLSMMAPFVLFAEHGQKFRTKSLLHGAADSESASLEFEVHGDIRLLGASDVATLTIHGRMLNAGKMSDETKHAKFELDTTVETKLGDYVLLAAGPSSTSKGDAVAVVVRITAQ